MIYDAVISTGDVTVSGCHSSELDTNTFGSLNVPSVASQNNSFYDVSLATGQDDMRLLLNGQELTQEIPSQGAATNETIFQIKTGDFFVKGSGVSSLERIKINFSTSTPRRSNSEIYYNVDTGGTFIATGDYGETLKTSVEGRYATSIFTDYDYFLNGQKVYSGVGVGCSVGTDGLGFIPLFGEGMVGGGIVTAENKNKFKYTAYRKRVRAHSLTGANPDFYSDTGFIEGRTNYYINGIQQTPDTYLELYSGVTMIKSGVSVNISGDFSKGLPVTSLSL
jgi:hypothetical protein